MRMYMSLTLQGLGGGESLLTLVGPPVKVSGLRVEAQLRVERGARIGLCGLWLQKNYVALAFHDNLWLLIESVAHELR